MALNPMRVTASNYATFADLDVDLPTGCVAIVGDNGAGKSSLLNLVDVALFAERGELASLLTIGEELLELCLEFEHAGELYRVRRGFSGRGRGKTTLDLERYDGGGFDPYASAATWEPLTRENVDATQALLEETIGLSRATFRASSFLAQGDGAAFTEAAPRERKAVLAEILGLELWDRMLERVRVDIAAARADRAAAEAKLEQAQLAAADREPLERAIAAYQVQLRTASDALVIAERDLDVAQEAKAAGQAAVERLRACQAELDAATADVRRAEAELAGAAAAEARQADLRTAVDEAAAAAEKIPMLEQQIEALTARTAAVARRDQLAGDIAAREQRRATIVDESFRLADQAADLRRKAVDVIAAVEGATDCDRCGQTLGADAAERAAASYRTEADQLDARAGQLDYDAGELLEGLAALREQAAAIEIPDAAGNPEEIRNSLTRARTAGERRAALAEQLRQAAEQAARRDELDGQLSVVRLQETVKQEAVDAARAKTADPAAADRAVADAKSRVDTARSDERVARESIVRAQAQLDRAAAAQAEREAFTGTIAMLDHKLASLTLAERAYGRDGIPALIVEATAIPQLETEANRILTDLGTEYRVELHTQRALKSDAGQLRETLDIVIVTPRGARPYETFSGGEKTRLNLALRIALARLLAHRRGAESRLLAIDEPDGLDAAGMERLATVLQGVAGTFERVMVVSHQPQLATSFDQVIRVVTDGERSRIATPAVEAVAV